MKLERSLPLAIIEALNLRLEDVDSIHLIVKVNGRKRDIVLSVENDRQKHHHLVDLDGFGELNVTQGETIEYDADKH